MVVITLNMRKNSGFTGVLICLKHHIIKLFLLL